MKNCASKYITGNREQDLQLINARNTTRQIIKPILILLILFSGLSQLFSQQIPVSNEYLLNPYLINPAWAGIDRVSKLQLTNRVQWAGLEDAPRTQSLSFDMRIKAMARYNHSGNLLSRSGIRRSGRVGLGIYALNDMNNPFRRSGVQFSYAYHLPLQRGQAGQLSMAASGSFFQHKIDNSGFKPNDINDPAIFSDESLLLPNFHFGLIYRYHNFFAAVSTLNLVPFKIKHYEESAETVKNQLYFHTGYKLGKPGKLTLSPALLYRSYTNSIDVSAAISFREKVNLAMLWQSTGATSALFHFKLGSYLVGYSFEYSLSEVKDYNDGTHLIYLGYHFN